MIKTVFCGSPEFAAISLKYLIDHGVDVKAVVTMPDKKQGRGQEIKFNPVKTMALNHNLPVLQPEKATDPDFLKTLADIKPDIIAVVAYGKILRKQFIDIPKFGCINLHSSLLPQYRGPSPIHWALLNGETETGVTTFLIDEGMDTGDVLMEKSVPILDTDNLQSLHDKLADEGAVLLYDTLHAYANQTPPKRRPQDHTKAIYTEKISTEMTVINWADPALKIHNLIRAMAPTPGARTTVFANQKTFNIKILNTTLTQNRHTTFKAGQVNSITKQNFGVICGDGIELLIQNVQLEGKSAVTSGEFLRGYTLAQNDCLGI